MKRARLKGAGAPWAAGLKAAKEVIAKGAVLFY
jgi:hypothetical protein